MAIAAVLTFSGGTLERYDALLAKLGFQSGEAGPRGALFSWVTMTEEGLHVTGVWQSKRDFEHFATDFGAFAAEAGVRGPPQIAFHDVHSYLTAGEPDVPGPSASRPAAARSHPPRPGSNPAPLM